MANQGTSIEDVFICLNITCPPGSYDANIEPSKDEVLFSDEDSLVSQFAMFCAEVYGQAAARPLKTPTNDVPEKVRSTEMEVGPPGLLTGNGQEVNAQPSLDLETSARTISGRQLPERTSITGVPGPATSVQDTTHDALNCSTGGQIDDDEPNHKGNKPGTPALPSFITASTLRSREEQSAPGERSGTSGAELPLSGRGWTGDMSTDLSEHTDGRKKRKTQTRHPLPTQKHSLVGDIARNDVSSMDPDRPLDPWSIARMNKNGRKDGLSGYGEIEEDASLCLTPEPDILHHYSAAPRDLNLPLGQLSSPTRPFKQPYASPMSSPLVSAHQTAPKPQTHDTVLRRRAQPPWTPPSSVQRDQQERASSYRSRYQDDPSKSNPLLDISNRQTNLDRFVSNRHGQGHTVADELSHSHLITSRGANIPREDCAAGEIEALNFRATRVSDAPVGSVFQRQDCKGFGSHNARALLTTQDQPAVEGPEPIITSIPTGDPRAYLLRYQKSVAAEGSSKAPRRGLKRVKSCYMPFESIQDNDATYNLSFQLSVEVQLLRSSVVLVARFDGYVDDGGVASALDMGTGEGHRVEQRLDHLLSKWNEQVTGGRTRIESQLTTSLKGKGTETP
ncbi:hypothetical protein PG999_013960 [Apiospora kogelbergensis]|uniref:Uncharacterized protein n=1 Tax=Apiospora kogelbergensis TaxID=1337665 RepID=A0AAW0Q7M3_9PEZI